MLLPISLFGFLNVMNCQNFHCSCHALRLKNIRMIASGHISVGPIQLFKGRLQAIVTPIPCLSRLGLNLNFPIEREGSFKTLWAEHSNF
jgi:hypothetical protein